MSESRITHPDYLLPSRLAAGEEYASVGAILECDDLLQATLHIPHWKIGGKEAAVRVRALSLSEREQVQRCATVVEQYCLTWQLGCVAPTFSQEQATALARKNPHAVEQGALFIWTLAALDQEYIDRVVQQETGAEANKTAEEPKSDAVPSPTP
jgi:hypothetical protein